MSCRLIRINGSRVYLDREAHGRGEFRVEPGTLSEQCEVCGEDINETGRIQGAYVVCWGESFCGARYLIKEGFI